METNSQTGQRLLGKVAIITGAARGQGECEARLFASQGAKVMLTDVLDDQLRAVAGDIGAAATSMHHDVSRENEWEAVIGRTLEVFGRLDVLVNNAAIHHVSAIEEETADAFNQIQAVNLLGTFLGIRAAIAPMRAAGGGSIVNVSSLAGLKGFHGHGAYAASKWGVRGLTQCAALELGPDNIRVNSVHPGMINTAMLPARPAGGELASALRGVPLGRVGEPDDVAALVLFLASDESSYLSGSEIAIDGGSHVGPPRRG